MFVRLTRLVMKNDMSVDRAPQPESSQIGLSVGTRCRENRQMKYSRILDFHRCFERFGVMSFVNGKFEHNSR